MTIRRVTWGLLACLALASGCRSSSDPAARPGGDAGNGGSGGSAGQGNEAPARVTRAARLTHRQWENTVRDLLYLEEPLGAAVNFRGDPRSAGFIFDNNALALEVDQALWSGYQRAAVAAAEFVTASPERLAAILPDASGDDQERARRFITEFGQRVQRRPLSTLQIEEYLAIFTQGQALFSGVAPFEAGMRLLLEAFLQAPGFLYRLEQSEAQEAGVIPLDDWEIAQRLAFFLWDSMPDAQLFAAAAAGSLRDPLELERQAKRLLADERAQLVVQHFHEQLFELEKYAGIAPSTTFFPDVSKELGKFARKEHELFVADVIFGKQGGYRALLTSPDTFVNAELARLYGLSGDFDDTFAPVTLDTSQRRGLLTHIGFLASHATSVQPDPIHRGVFLLRRITCADIAAPPDNIPPLPPIENTTNRQAVADHTEQPGTMCVNCHGAFINPLGFPFENYDAVGAYRTLDNDLPVDASSDPLIGETTLHVNNALELVDALAQSLEVHACYAKHWLEFSQGRSVAAEDTALVAELSQLSLDEDLAVQDLIVKLVTTPSFINRNKEELP